MVSRIFLLSCEEKKRKLNEVRLVFPSHPGQGRGPNKLNLPVSFRSKEGGSSMAVGQVNNWKRKNNVATSRFERHDPR